MSEILQAKMDIAASLYYCPTTEENLFKRDFLQNKSRFGIQLLLRQMETDDWIRVDKSGIILCNKRVVKSILNKHGYEID